MSDRKIMLPGSLGRIVYGSWLHLGTGPGIHIDQKIDTPLNKDDLFLVIKNCDDTSLQLHDQWHLVMTRFGIGWLSIAVWRPDAGTDNCEVIYESP